MITLHPNILEKDGEKVFAVLPYEEFKNLQEELNEYEDLRDLRAAKEENADSIITPLEAVRNELEI